MKRLVLLFLFTMFFLSLTACTNQNTVSVTSSSIIEEQTSSLTESTPSANTDKTSSITSNKTSSTVSNSVSSVAHPAPGGNFPNAPSLILNGKKLDVYTSHYDICEEYAVIPIEAFLMSVGAEYSDSPLNKYGTQCYSFMGKRYVVIGEYHLFMLEDDYEPLLQKLCEDGIPFFKETAADYGLLPKNKSKVLPGEDSGIIWGTIWTDHISLMNALIESGVDITIKHDYSTRTITVTLPQKNS